MIKIEKVNGDDRRLYELVAGLAMDREVLKQNNNYPFWTSPRHVWFVAHDGKGQTSGFFPVEVTARSAKINNYYVAGDKAALLNRLMREVLRGYGEKQTIRAVVLARHATAFKSAGFQAVRELKRYSIMEYIKA